MPIMTVGDLRKALEDIPDELEVIVYSLEEGEQSDNDIETCCPLMTAEQQMDEEDEPFFALYANNGNDFEEEGKETEDDFDGVNAPRACD